MLALLPFEHLGLLWPLALVMLAPLGRGLLGRGLPAPLPFLHRQLLQHLWLLVLLRLGLLLLAYWRLQQRRILLLLVLEQPSHGHH
jgi:hypothetical protein